MGDADPRRFEERFPLNFFGNVVGDPHFVTYDPDAGNFDLRLQADSAALDAGVDLTTTLTAGSGRVLPVEDANYFHAGYNGMIPADTIRVGGQDVIITAIDYEANLITVDRDIAWQAGEPVNLPFVGGAPDIGAYEGE